VHAQTDISRLFLVIHLRGLVRGGNPSRGRCTSKVFGIWEVRCAEDSRTRGLEALTPRRASALLVHHAILARSLLVSTSNHQPPLLGAAFTILFSYDLTALAQKTP